MSQTGSHSERASSSSGKVTAMAEHGEPRVVTVETYNNLRPPPIPPRATRRALPRRGGAGQSLLFMLVGLALCGMVIEAYCILQLYKNTNASSGSTSKLTADEDEARRIYSPPRKPTAHLTYGTDVVHAAEVMGWSRFGSSRVLHEIGYSNGSLVIHRDGYYYVYSKVAFKDTQVFYHSINLRTDNYQGRDIALLTSRKYSVRGAGPSSNSYLGGVFHLQVNNTVCVKVTNTADLLLHSPQEHVFGAFML